MDVKSRKVMLVDDDPDYLEAGKSVLEEHGYEVVLAHNATECMDKVHDEQPDLIVLDAAMPLLSDGFRVSRELRDSDQTSHIPQIMVSGIGERLAADFRPDGKWLPVDRFVEKPIEPHQLLEEVNTILNK